ncbi:MAG: hypothetical protein ACTTIX_08290 [Peptoanaerobacter stomatis]
MNIKKIIATTLLMATTITALLPSTKAQAALKDLQKTRKAVQKNIIVATKKNPYGSLMKMLKEDAFKGKNKIIDKKNFKDAVIVGSYAFGLLTDAEYKEKIQYIKDNVKDGISGASMYIATANLMEEKGFPYYMNSNNVNLILTAAMYGWDELSDDEKIFAIDLLLFSQASVNSSMLEGKYDMPTIKTYKDLSNVPVSSFAVDVLRSGVTYPMMMLAAFNTNGNKKSKYKDKFVGMMYDCIDELHYVGLNLSMLKDNTLFAPSNTEEAEKEYIKLRDKRIKANKDDLNQVIKYARYKWFEE